MIENNASEDAGKSASALNGHPSIQLQRSPRITRKGTPGVAPRLDTATHQRASRILAPESLGSLIGERRDEELR